MSGDERIRASVSYALGLEVLRRCSHALRPVGIYPMPLKGLWLQRYVYAAVEERAITDVDVIVPDGAFALARRTLEGAGFRAHNANASEVALFARDLPLPIDLHARLFMPGAFALPTQGLFARASAPVDLEGARVVLPDPVDALCHLVGHFVKSRCVPGDARRTRDFVVVVQRFGLAPGHVAARLQAAGMGRAARYAFSDLAATEPVFAEILATLPTDTAGDLLAKACARVRASGGLGPPFRGTLVDRAARALPGYLLERSLPAAGKALLLRAVSLSADQAHTSKVQMPL
jgi:hypothetical protein